MLFKRYARCVLLAAAAFLPAIAGCTRYIDDQETPPGHVPPVQDEQPPAGDQSPADQAPAGGEM